MTKTDIGIYRGLKEKFDPEVHVGFFITTDTGELLLGDQSLGQTISGWEINDGVLTLKLNTGKDIRVTFPEATETVKGLLSAADKAQLNALQANLDSKVDKVTGKSLLADSEIEKLAGLPNSTELTNSIATAKAAGDNAQSDLNAHKQNKSNPHEVTKAQVGLGNVTNDAQVKRSEMGVANGVATLDADGKVPASQLPSYVDDIIDVYATYSKSDTGVLSNVTLYLDAAHTQLVTGEAGKIYQNIADGEPQYQFRWTGTIFSQTGASSLILGEVTGTAYDGAKGKANADNIAKIKGTSLSHIKDAAPITTAADKVSLNYECFEGNQYGAAGTDHTADIPAATTAKAGVMSAADKTKLENLNSKLVVADEEDVTAVDGKIKLKDRDTTNGMGYKILRLPENGILTQDMINEPNTIYEIRYDFDLNGATITIPENCTLKFEGGSLSNGVLQLNSTDIVSDDSYILKCDINGHTKFCNIKATWMGFLDNATLAFSKIVNTEMCVEFPGGDYTINGGNYILRENTYLKGLSERSTRITFVPNEDTKFCIGIVRYSGISDFLFKVSKDVNIDVIRLDTSFVQNTTNYVLRLFTIKNIYIEGTWKDDGYQNITGLGIYTRDTNDDGTPNLNRWNAIVGMSFIENLFIKNCFCGIQCHIEQKSNNENQEMIWCNSISFNNLKLDCKYGFYVKSENYVSTKPFHSSGSFYINDFEFQGDRAKQTFAFVMDGTQSCCVINRLIAWDADEIGKCINHGAATINTYKPSGCVPRNGDKWVNGIYYETIENGSYSTINKGFKITNELSDASTNSNYSRILSSNEGTLEIIPRTNYGGKKILEGRNTQTESFEERYVNNGGYEVLKTDIGHNNLKVSTINYNEYGEWITIYDYSNSFGNTNNRPQNICKGFKYFDTTLNRPVYWNGTKWVDPAEDSIKWRTIE